MWQFLQLLSIYSKFTSNSVTLFQPVSVHTVKEVIEGLASNKTPAVEIPIKIFKENGFTYEYLTSALMKLFHPGNSQILLKCQIQCLFTRRKIRLIHNYNYSYSYNYNYGPVSILSLLSKAFEKIMYDQLYIYMNNFLNELLCGFRKAHSTQHALFKLLQAWQKELDNSGFIGTILMNLSKAYDCLSHDLLIAKLGSYGLDRSSLRLLMDYLNPLSAKFIKWSNTLKQIVGKLPTICLSVFDHFSGLEFKGLIPVNNKQKLVHPTANGLKLNTEFRKFP